MHTAQHFSSSYVVPEQYTLKVSCLAVTANGQAGDIVSIYV